MRGNPHLTAVIAAVVTVLVVTPVSVRAATATLVNIADHVTSKKARVGTGNALLVETRPGNRTNAVNMKAFANTTGTYTLWEGDKQFMVTEMTFATLGGAAGSKWDIALVAFKRESGTNPCGGIGWKKTSLRDVTLATNQPTEQLHFSGPPLVLPTISAGQRLCYAVEVWNLPSSAVLRMGGTGYRSD